MLFIPAHLVPEVVDGAAKTHIKDDFGFEMITAGKFTTAQIDKNTWSEEMLDMLMDFIKNDPRGEKYTVTSIGRMNMILRETVIPMTRKVRIEARETLL